VNVAIRAGAQNIGFALPIDFVIERSAEMVNRRRGGPRLGLVVKNGVTRPATESAAKRAEVVDAVETGSAAATAGFKAGDVIDQIDDVVVATAIDLERGLLDKGNGAKVAVRLTRAGAATTVDLALEQAAAKVVATPAEVAWKRLGIKLQPVAAEAVAKANPQLHGGLLVTEVVAGGAASAAGIQKGDVLVGLHNWETLRVDDVAFVLNHKDFASFLPLKYYTARDGKLKDGWLAGTP
jgi:serine protease Do